MSDLRTNPTRADLRAFQRLRTGVSYHRNSPILFMTLTHPPDQEVTQAQAKRHVQKLLEWLRQDFTVEYFQVHTAEGNGNVHHLALVSDHLPVKEVRARWEALTGASQMDLQRVRKWTAFYLEMTRQQKTSRYSMSRGWLWKGASQDWKKITRHFSKWDPEKKTWTFNKVTAMRRWQERIQEMRPEPGGTGGGGSDQAAGVKAA